MKMPSLNLCLAVVCLTANQCFSQAVGSAGAYNSLVDSMHSLRDDQIQWENATKLSLVGNTNISYSEMLKSEPSCLNFKTMKIGDTGTLSYWIFTVSHVIDATNCIISIGRGGLRRSFVLSNFPTDKIVDDVKVVLVDDVKVTGTKTAGSRKYLMLEFKPIQIQLEEQRQKEQAIAEQAEQKEKVAQAQRIATATRLAREERQHKRIAQIEDEKRVLKNEYQSLKPIADGLTGLRLEDPTRTAAARRVEALFKKGRELTDELLSLQKDSGE